MHGNKLLVVLGLFGSLIAFAYPESTPQAVALPVVPVVKTVESVVPVPQPVDVVEETTPTTAVEDVSSSILTTDYVPIEINVPNVEARQVIEQGRLVKIVIESTLPQAAAVSVATVPQPSGFYSSGRNCSGPTCGFAYRPVIASRSPSYTYQTKRVYYQPVTSSQSSQQYYRSGLFGGRFRNR